MIVGCEIDRADAQFEADRHVVDLTTKKCALNDDHCLSGLVLYWLFSKV